MTKIFSFRFVFLLALVFVFLNKIHAQPTLAIFTYQDDRHKPWDKTSVNEGITGSEEAIIYISEYLAEIGFQVTIYGNPPVDSPFSEEGQNPRYVSIHHKESTKYDIAISWRQPWGAGYLKQRAEKVYLWPHDILDRYVSDEYALGFDDVLWTSDWQRWQWISQAPAFAKFTNIFGNGLNIESFGEVQERKNPYSCIYASNYARGLEILLDIWPQVKAIFPKATLDIYYGWQHWGTLYPQTESKMRKQVEDLQAYGVTEHGMVGHDELHKAFEKTSFWTYPCISPETFCITAIKAQYAGAIPVILNNSALMETVRFGKRCSLVKDYLTTLVLAMLDAKDISVEERESMRYFIENEYTWKVIAEKWKETFLKSL